MKVGLGRDGQSGTEDSVQAYCYGLFQNNTSTP
jgi:hypothetical protein